MSKFPIPYRERQDFAEKYCETLVTLLQKYLQRRLPPEWGYEIRRELENKEGNMEALDLKLCTKSSKEQYSSSIKIPFLIYIPNELYVEIPSFSEIENKVLEFIKNSNLEFLRIFSLENPDYEQTKGDRLKKLRILASKARSLGSARG